MRARSRVLLIEDDPVDAALVRRSLSDPLAETGFELELAPALQFGIDRLAKGGIDIVLLDLHLPDSRGSETLVRLREHEADVPVVVFTVANEDDLARAALEAGAQDYLVKEDVAASAQLLRRTLRHAVERARIEREQVELHEQVARTERMASLGVLSAGLAMGFQRLLGAILEDTDAAIEELQQGDRGRLNEHLGTVRRAALQAGEITGQLRDYAAAQQGHAIPMDLSRFVLSASEMITPMVEGRADANWHVAAGGPVVEADPLALLQILTSLMTNAAEASASSSGAVTVTTGSLCADRELLDHAQGFPAAEEGLYGFLRVADNGHGMDSTTRERIFEPFFTTRHAGRGLGLSAVLGLVREMRGVIRVESRPGEGSTFTVLFPAVVGQA